MGLDSLLTKPVLGALGGACLLMAGWLVWDRITIAGLERDVAEEQAKTAEAKEQVSRCEAAIEAQNGAVAALQATCAAEAAQAETEALRALQAPKPVVRGAGAAALNKWLAERFG